MRKIHISDLLRIQGDFARIKPSYVLSILDPDGTPAPDLGLSPEHHHVIRCIDTEGVDGPGREIIAAIRAFASVVPEDAEVIAHCHAGLSRSPAAALIILDTWGQELDLGPVIADPNRRMLGLADGPSGLLTKVGRAYGRRAAAYADGLNDWISPDDR